MLICSDREYMGHCARARACVPCVCRPSVCVCAHARARTAGLLSGAHSRCSCRWVQSRSDGSRPIRWRIADSMCSQPMSSSASRASRAAAGDEKGAEEQGGGDHAWTWRGGEKKEGEYSSTEGGGAATAEAAAAVVAISGSSGGSCCNGKRTVCQARMRPRPWTGACPTMRKGRARRRRRAHFGAARRGGVVA